MAMRNQVTISITEQENQELDLIKQKGIKIIDVFRRGLDGYIRDVLGTSTEENSQNKGE